MTNVAEIYASNYKELVCFSYKITKSYTLAEEAVSELFKRLNRIVNTRGITFDSIDLMRGWLFKSLRGCCLTLLKKESKYVDLDKSCIESVVDETDVLQQKADSQDAVSLSILLNEEIKQLTPKQQQVILLRYFSGGIMSYAEIARRTNSNESAVGFLISKATDKLKSRLVAKWQTQQT